MKIDLSKKPDGATHINPHSGVWVKCFGGNSGSYQFFRSGEWEMGFGCMSNSYLEIAQPAPWTGEGLPPVGTLCEAEIYDGKGQLVWAESLIIHHHPHHNNSAAIAHGNGQLLGWASKFRPIHTPEQIAADKRLHEIRNALSAINSKVHFPNDLVRGNILAAAVEAMIDAGYRKQVAP
jgi:hypothetical protein